MMLRAEQPRKQYFYSFFKAYCLNLTTAINEETITMDKRPHALDT